MFWNDTLATWSAEIASTCVYEHSNAAGDHHYGQNIGAGYHPDAIDGMITNGMYNGEINLYDGWSQDDGEPTADAHGWGHFSQIVWKGSTSVGCATMNCSDVGGMKNLGEGFPPYFTVCNYFPVGRFLSLSLLCISWCVDDERLTILPGNVAGGYRENVPKPGGWRLFGSERRKD